MDGVGGAGRGESGQMEDGEVGGAVRERRDGLTASIIKIKLGPPSNRSNLHFFHGHIICLIARTTNFMTNFHQIESNNIQF